MLAKIFNPNEVNYNIREKPIAVPEDLCIALKNGYILNCNEKTLKVFLLNFDRPETIHDKVDATDIIQKPSPFKSIDLDFDLEFLEGRTYAYITDQKKLMINYPVFNQILIKSMQDAGTVNTYISVAEFAKKYEKTPMAAKKHCRKNRIPGAIKVGNSWAIPSDASWPDDLRYNEPEL